MRSTGRSKSMRFMGWRDLIITPAVSASILGIAGIVTWAMHRTWSIGFGTMLLVFFVAQAAAAMMAIRIVLSLRFPKEGVFSLDTHVVDCYVFNLLGFLCITHLWFEFSAALLPPLIRKPFCQLIGARFGRGLTPVAGPIQDPWFVSIEETAMVGKDTLILAHALTTHELLLAKVKIGKGSIIGAKSLIMPGVRVGEYSMVNAISLVAANTTIGSYELWGGVPAKKIRDLPRPKARSVFPRSEIVVENILELARSQPQKIAAKIIVGGGRQLRVLTFGELVRESSRYANLYVRRGIKPKDVLVVLLEHGPDLLCAYVGALMVGAVPTIFAPPSTKATRSHYATTLNETMAGSGTRFVITDARLSHDMGQASEQNIEVLQIDEARDCSAQYRVRHPFHPEDVVLLQHSSGTTGQKKGVALSNRAVIHQLRNYASAISLDENDRIVSWLPLYHDMGLIACLHLPLACGVPVVMMSAFDWVANPITLLETITKERGTLCWMPNFAYNFLATRVDEQHLQSIDLRSVRAFINCSEPIRADSHAMFLERFRTCGLKPNALATCYAMAENTFAVTQGGIREPVRIEEIPGSSRTSVSSGRPIAENKLRIVDEHRCDLPERAVGEIAIQSTSMLDGYHRRPDLTAAAVVGGWYFTGDLGFLSEGHLFVTGRKKDLLIIAGKNIDPGDIEDVVSRVEGVHPGRVVAFGVANDLKGTEDLVVVAETKVHDEATRRRIKLEIARSIREHIDLAADEIQVVPHQTLLKSSSGKIARSANRERYLSNLMGGRNVAVFSTQARKSDERDSTAEL